MFQEIKNSKIEETDENPAIKLYQNMEIETDWSIILTQNSTLKMPMKTKTGQIIADGY